jgi:hypothetical protein
MGKKKGKKKESKKKDLKKKKLRKKDKKKKDKKKEWKKQQPEKKKKDRKKRIRRQEPFNFPLEQKVEKPKVQALAPDRDKSSNYNVLDALKKLKTLKSEQKVLEFTKGEKRKTVAKAIAPALRKLKR